MMDEEWVEQILSFLECSDVTDADSINMDEAQAQKGSGAVIAGNNVDEYAKIKAIDANAERTDFETITMACKGSPFMYPVWKPKECESMWHMDAVQLSDFSSQNAKDRSNGCEEFTQEIQRAIYGDVDGHPKYGSTDYYQAAENYAIFGKEFLDFPEALHELLMSEETMGTADYLTENDGTYNANTAADNSANLNVPRQTAATPFAASASYVHMFNATQQAARPGYGVFLGNKFTYVSAGQSVSSWILNQHTATVTNIISNNMAGLAASSHLLQPNPVLTTVTQQCLNTLFKDRQIMSNNSTQNGSFAPIGGLYERLVYAQLVQQHILRQIQQAAFMNAVLQQKARICAANSAGNFPAVNVGTAAAVAALRAKNCIGQQCCGRQVTVALKSNGGSPKKSVTLASTDDIATTMSST